MEEKVEVKAVEEKVETSPAQKEAAVLDAAIKEGDVNPEYGLQSDGVYKVNLDKPPKQKEDALKLPEKEETMQRLWAKIDLEIAKEHSQKEGFANILKELGSKNKAVLEAAQEVTGDGGEVDSIKSKVADKTVTDNESKTRPAANTR